MPLIKGVPKLHSFVLVCLVMGPVYAQKTEPLVFEHNAEIVCAQYNADGDLLITASVNGIVKLWDAETGKLIRSFGATTPPSKSFYADFSPDGKLIATIFERSGKVWSTKFGDLVFSLNGYSDTIKSIHFSKNSKWLIAGSLDGTVKLWDVQTGKRHHSLNHMYESLGKKEQKNGVTDAKFCDKDKSIVTGSGKASLDFVPIAQYSSMSATDKKYSERYDSSSLVWDMKTGKVIHTLVGYPFDVSPDGSRIVTGSVNTTSQTAQVWDVATGSVIHLLRGHNGKVTACQFSKDGKWILTSSAEDGTCKLWETSGKSVCYLNTGPVNTGSIAHLSPNDKMISTFSQDTTKIWNIATGKLLHALPSGRSPVFSIDSRRVIVLTGNRATVYEALSGKPVMVEKKPAGKEIKKALKEI